MPVAGVIIPYRDRAENLETLLPRLVTLLKRAGHGYHVAVVHQHDRRLFNKAAVMNAGAVLLRNQVDYYLFHDVDAYPESEDTDTYGPKSRSGSVVSQYKGFYAFHDDQTWGDDTGYFGGCLHIKHDDFWRINGFSLKFWGWGAEEDNILHRLKYYQVPLKRHPGVFRDLQHHDDARYHNNPHFQENQKLLYQEPDPKDGASQLQFQVVGRHDWGQGVRVYDVEWSGAAAQMSVEKSRQYSRPVSLDLPHHLREVLVQTTGENSYHTSVRPWWVWLLVALAAAVGGALVLFESRRTLGRWLGVQRWSTADPGDSV